MKKFLYIVFTTLFIALLVGCSNNSTNNEKEKFDESKKFEEIKIGETISLEFGEVSLDILEVKPRYDFKYTTPTTTGTSTNTYFIEPETSDLQLISLRGKLTNKTTETLSTEYASLKLINGIMEINGNKYEIKFDDMNVNEAIGYERILAQQTVDYFLYAEVPSSIVNDITSCKITLGIKNNFGNNQSEYDDFNPDNYDYVYEINAIPTK